jgi:hypothetical protein
MPTRILFAAAALLLLTAKAEEQPSPILTALSSTTISGYVDVSAHWNPGSAPIRFEDLCRELRERGFQMKRYGKHHLFLRSDRLAFYLCKQGPFARPSDVRQVRRLLKRAA